jgi:Flp pilus assembly protein TadD
MRSRYQLLILVFAIVVLAASQASAQLRITIPKGSKPTPVQKLNQQGVKAVQDHNFEEAKRLFYKAYLLDPNDPFTLNNLGYIAELEGQVDRAQRFYALAAEHATDATVAAATLSSLKGKSVSDVAGKTEDRKLKINQYNLEAIGLILKDRAPEADLVLQKALQLDPQNPFTLNNLGFAREKEGELESALSFYVKASNLHSHEPVIVTPQKDWRGKAISKVAAENADKLRKLMQESKSVEARVARLNLQGVSAANRNEPKLARQYFEQAYKLDPNNAFTLNNLGYMAELAGDRETAEFYYARAQQANKGGERVDIATRRDMEGKRVREIAGHGETEVEARIEASQRVRALEGGPVFLRHRNGSPVVEPERPPQPVAAPEAGPPPTVMTPPANHSQPPTVQPNSQPAGGLLMPLPENQQPPAAQEPVPQQGAPKQAAPQAPQGGLLMPLPEDQQPPAARQPGGQQPASQAAPQGGGGLLMPLPEDQQPPAARQR